LNGPNLEELGKYSFGEEESSPDSSQLKPINITLEEEKQAWKSPQKRVELFPNLWAKLPGNEEF